MRSWLRRITCKNYNWKYKDLLWDKSEQLIEKSEALISCQSTNVKHLLKLAQAMKEKMDQHVLFEENKKIMNYYHEQLIVKEKERLNMQEQSGRYQQMKEQLDEEQVKLRLVITENGQLKEKLKLQELELGQQKAKVRHISIGQLSLPSTASV